jgi:hypothetical protein
VNNFGIEVQKIPYKAESKNAIARSDTTKQSSLLNEKRDCQGLRRENRSYVIARSVATKQSLLWNKPEGGNPYSLRFRIPHQVRNDIDITSK